MRVRFRVELTESGHMPYVHEDGLEPHAGMPDRSGRCTAERVDPYSGQKAGQCRGRLVRNPDKRYHAVLWPETDGVSGPLEIDWAAPIQLKNRIELEV